LRAWMEADERIPTYQRVNDDTIKLLRHGPDDTGFERHLYSLDDVSPEQRARIEKKFFGEFVDDLAAKVYRKIVETDPLELTFEERKTWARYLMAQRARTPGIVKHIRKITNERIRDLLIRNNDRYMIARDNDGGELPETALEWFDRTNPGERANKGLEILMRLIQEPTITNALIEMHWWVYDASMSLVPVLASDRPLRITRGIGEPGCIVSLPLTPSKIFMASPKISVRDAFARQEVTATTSDHNRVVAYNAGRCVYGKSDMVFIQRYMGTVPESLPTVRDEFG